MEIFVGLHILLLELYVTVFEYEDKVIARYESTQMNMIAKHLWLNLLTSCTSELGIFYRYIYPYLVASI